MIIHKWKLENTQILISTFLENGHLALRKAQDFKNLVRTNEKGCRLVGRWWQQVSTKKQGRPVQCRARIWWIRAVSNIQDACGEATPPPLWSAEMFNEGYAVY